MSNLISGSYDRDGIRAVLNFKPMIEQRDIKIINVIKRDKTVFKVYKIMVSDQA